MAVFAPHISWPSVEGPLGSARDSIVNTAVAIPEPVTMTFRCAVCPTQHDDA